MRYLGLAAMVLLPAASFARHSTSAAQPAVTPQHVMLTPAGDGHDTIPVYVDGKGPYPFILDTGADQSAVYQWFADRARLKMIVGKDQTLSGQTGSAKVRMYHMRTVSLAGIKARNLEAYGLPNRRDKGNEAGILGNDIMDQAIVAFDFPCRKIEIQPRSVPAQAAVGAAPPSIAGIDAGTTLLTLPVTINGAEGIAVLDTGSRWTRLTPSFAKAAGIDTTSREFRDAEPFYGTSGDKIVPRAGPTGKLTVGGQVITNLTAQVVALPMLAQDFGDKPSMLLGADVLGRFRFVYDHAARKVWFLPSRCSVRS